MEYSPLIYGKNPLERVVSVEPFNDTTTVFLEDIQGNITTQTLPNRYWLLSNEKLDRHFVRLKGDLHYCYGRQYVSRAKFKQEMSIFRRKYKDIFCCYDDKEAMMVKDGITYYKGCQPKEISALSFDIETTGLFHNKDSKVLLISNTFRKAGVVTKKLFAYDEFADEGEMIEAWCSWVREVNPSILLGHNIFSYDLQYLQFVANRYNKELLLGRDGSALYFNSKESKFRVDGSRDQSYFKARCYGRELIDTYFIINRWDIGRSLTSYGLKSAIKELGLEKECRTFYDASQIRFKYQDKEEWKKIKEYCIDDSDDALNLFDKISPAFFYMTQTIPKSFQNLTETAAGSQLNAMMIRSYLQDAHSIPKASEMEKFPGGISNGFPGVYRNCLKFDAISEYPSIIMAYKVYDEKKDPKAHLLAFTHYFFEKRIAYKDEFKKTKNPEYDAMQNCFKVLLNSLYGFLGASGLNFNYLAGASLITQKGRETVSTAVKWATGKEYEEIIKDVEK